MVNKNIIYNFNKYIFKRVMFMFIINFFFFVLFYFSYGLVLSSLITYIMFLFGSLIIYILVKTDYEFIKVNQSINNLKSILNGTNKKGDKKNG